MKIAVSVVIGLAVGFLAGSIFVKTMRKPAEPPAPQASKPAPAPPPVPPQSNFGDVGSTTAPDPEVEKLRARVAELETKLAKAAAPPAEAPVEEVEIGVLTDRIKALAPKGLRAFSDPELGKLIEELKKKGAKGVEAVADMLLNSKSQDERFLAGAILEGLKDPASIPALSESLGKDEAGLVRRMSSHALAMIGTEASLPALRAAMSADKDWGVRVNSAYGVAKQGQPDGAKVLEDAYYSKEAAGYQAIIFNALADAATPANAPFFRKVLGESSEIGYLIGSIGALEKLKDAESVSLLNRIAGDAKYDPTVREAAKKAAETLSK